MSNHITLNGAVVQISDAKTIKPRNGGEPRSVQEIRFVTKRHGGKDAPKDYFNVSFFGKTAETITRFAHLGQRLVITGRMELQQWKGEDDENRQKYVVIADQVDIIDWPKRDEDDAPAEDEAGALQTA